MTTRTISRVVCGFGIPAIIALAMATSARAASMAVAAGWAFRPAGEHGVRITWAGTNSVIALNPALVDGDWSRPEIQLKPGEEVTRAKVGSMRVTVAMAGHRVTVEDDQGRRVQELEFDPAANTITFAMDGPILGLGEGGEQFDRRGMNIPLTRTGGVPNGQGLGLAELGTRVLTPFLLGTKGWALFFGTPYGTFDLRGDRGRFTPVNGSAPGQLDLFVIDARVPEDAMREFILLTGAPALPPKWALGYMQSHRTLTTEKDVLDELRTFREKRLPCDAVIYLGTGFCPAGWNLGHDSFAWNTNVFTRGPAEVLDDIHALHFHAILHVVPLQRDYPQLHGQIPPPPGAAEDSRSITSYWDRHRELFADGVDGWWPDEGDWLDVASRLERHRLYYEGPLAEKPDVRPWDLQRNGYAGISQYGGWYWSGDVQSSWQTLAAQVQVGQNASLSVSPFWGTDTGGFNPAPDGEYTGELYTRWFQFSTFCPSFRSHGRTWRLHLPWGWDTGGTGYVESRPAPPESELHNAAVEPICRQYLELRYQLMPYTYTITREARDTGLPLMRALWLHYPEDPRAVALGSEYLWGRDILVAPVTQPGATNRVVYLPAGDWYDWWTLARSGGGREVNRAVDLKTMPLYVRAGAIIPFDPVRQYMDEPVSGPTKLRIYRGANGHFVLYDDDGRSQDYLKPETGTWTELTWNDQAKMMDIKPDRRTHTKQITARQFDVVLLPDNQHRLVSFMGREVQVHF